MKLFSILAAILILLFGGCVSTKPNIPFSGNQHPSTLNQLYAKNPLLVNELGKLPEIQDGISKSENKTLGRLFDLYVPFPKTFDASFDEMYRIGLPDVRKYCSPLQALFWLLDDNKSEELIGFIENNAIKELINYSWLSSKKDNWENFEIVTDRINAPELLNLYIKQRYSYKFDHGICCQSPKTTFTKKSGCCVCLALLGKKFLDRAGYKTFIRHLKGSWDQHGVLVAVLKGEYYIAVDFKIGGDNTTSGPFNNVSEIDNQISKVTGSPILRRIYWEGECGF